MRRPGETHPECIPLLAGMRKTLSLGIFSSPQPQNVRLRRAIRNLEEANGAALCPALSEPQTAGGLLAFVPGGQAGACLAALHAAGQIGRRSSAPSLLNRMRPRPIPS